MNVVWVRSRWPRAGELFAVPPWRQMKLLALAPWHEVVSQAVVEEMKSRMLGVSVAIAKAS